MTITIIFLVILPKDGYPPRRTIRLRARASARIKHAWWWRRAGRKGLAYLREKLLQKHLSGYDRPYQLPRPPRPSLKHNQRKKLSRNWSWFALARVLQIDDSAMVQGKCEIISDNCISLQQNHGQRQNKEKTISAENGRNYAWPEILQWVLF